MGIGRLEGLVFVGITIRLLKSGRVCERLKTGKRR